MRGSVKDHFGVFRGDSLGLIPAGDRPKVAAPMVEDDSGDNPVEKKANDGKPPAMDSPNASDSVEESMDVMDDDSEKKMPARKKAPSEKKISVETVADIDGDEADPSWSKKQASLPAAKQQTPLRPKPQQKEQSTIQSPQLQAGLAARMSPQGASLNAAGLASAMAGAPNLMPVAPNVPMGWAALAAFPQGLAASQIPEAQVPPRPPPPPGPQTLLYTVGFGIDPRQAMHDNWDATEAAVRALRDAMERSTVRLPPSSTGSVQHSPFQIHVKLGVPPRTDVLTLMEPMAVDMTRIASVLPRSIPILPVDVVVGGLSVSGKDDPDVSICTAVACVTVQTNTNAQRHAWERAAVAAVQQQQQQQQQRSVQSPMETSAWTELERRRESAAARNMVSRVDSMEMLARISEQVRERPFALGALADQLRPDEISPNATGDAGIGGAVEEGKNDRGDEQTTDNYKKLPPGVTAKNNKRQFVQHHYHDHSLEKPTPMDEPPIYSARGKSVGTAFPVKLHELLTEIEADGYAYIISWLPHGRAFKIHKQEEFLDKILKNYFVMTKKSSFLRQLNLYGFNRLSAGPDKGAYYHELFLRGMPFLCKRMVRMKVNGNGIRAAGNPDAEPDFYKMPPVPREMTPRDILKAFSNQQQQEEERREQIAVAQAQEPNVIEHALISSPRPVSPKVNAGNNQVSFPLKLQRMLDKLEAEGDTDVVSWLSHGRAFIVHKPDEFVKGLMPAFFRQTKYSSFQRQLHMYTFQRITAGPDKGAYYHDNFLRGKPRLAQKMVRTRVNGKGCRKPGNPSAEPDFYSMKPIDPIEAGTVVEIPNECVDFLSKASSSDDEAGEKDDHDRDM